MNKHRLHVEAMQILTKMLFDAGKYDLAKEKASQCIKVS